MLDIGIEYIKNHNPEVDFKYYNFVSDLTYKIIEFYFYIQLLIIIILIYLLDKEPRIIIKMIMKFIF